MAKEVKDNYTIQLENDKGEIVISNDVIGVIAGLAAVEVDGVVSMAGEITKELISKLSLVLPHQRTHNLFDHFKFRAFHGQNFVPDSHNSIACIPQSSV